MEPSGTVILKPGKERKVKNFYPWIQRGEVAKVEGDPADGSLVRLVNSEGEFQAIATWNSQSRFKARVLTTQEEEINEEFFKNRFTEALNQRATTVAHTNGRRIVYSEADLLPGLIIDEYASHLVVQVRSLPMEELKPIWLPALVEASQALSIYERSEMAGRKEEGLDPYAGQLHGETPDLVEISEDGLKYLVPPKSGLKTGFYLDQRNTRRRLGELIQPGQRLLDAFCYSGAFSIRAQAAGAETLGLDLNPEAIELAKKNAELNEADCQFEEANVFEWLEANPEEKFDWIVLDPPAISKTSKTRDSLKWAVWKLVNRAIPLLNPGGKLIVCSCSYQLNQKELIETCRLAASDQGVRLFLEDVTLQDHDHPAPVQFPEALYLKCAWLRLG